MSCICISRRFSLILPPCTRCLWDICKNMLLLAQLEASTTSVTRSELGVQMPLLSWTATSVLSSLCRRCWSSTLPKTRRWAWSSFGHLTWYLKVATILGTEATRQQSVNYGCVVEDKNTHTVLHYVEKPSSYISCIINCGVYVFSSQIFPMLAVSKRVTSEKNSLVAGCVQQQARSGGEKWGRNNLAGERCTWPSRWHKHGFSLSGDVLTCWYALL